MDYKREKIEILPNDTTSENVIKYQINQAENTDCDDSFMVCHIGDVINKYKTWVKLMPRIKPYYAMKCNDDDIVLEVLAKLGASFDCASKNEIQKVLDLGVEPERIIYAHTSKQPSMLKFAKENHVDLLTFDSETELYKIRSLHSNARLVLRISPGGLHTCKIDLRRKFGCLPSQERELLQLAKKLGLCVVGVSFHVGSGCDDAQAYGAAITHARKVFNMAIAFGFRMNLLDIGGGYPGHTGTFETFKQIADVVNSYTSKHFPEDVNIIAEPGTYMVASSCILVVNIIGKRWITEPTREYSSSTENSTTRGVDLIHENGAHIQKKFEHKIKNGEYTKESCEFLDIEECAKYTEECDRNIQPDVKLAIRNGIDVHEESDKPDHNDHFEDIVMYYVNDGAYGCFSDVLIVPENLQLNVKSVKANAEVKLYNSVIWGPTCCAHDCIIKSARLPEYDVGDWLYFEDMGAYTTTLASSFNGMPRPRMVHVCYEDIWNSAFPTDQIVPPQNIETLT